MIQVLALELLDGCDATLDKGTRSNRANAMHPCQKLYCVRSWVVVYLGELVERASFQPLINLLSDLVADTGNVLGFST